MASNLLTFFVNVAILAVIVGFFIHFVIRRFFGERGVQLTYTLMSVVAAAASAAFGLWFGAGLWGFVALLRGFLLINDPRLNKK